MTAVDELRGVIGLRVPGSLAYRHLAVRFVTAACKIVQGSEESEEDGGASTFEPEVVSAFGEAFNNVAVHGFRDRTPEPVHIEIDWDEDKLVITMIDTGETFDPTSVAPPDLDEMPESGMGIFIMTSCMDVIDYQPGPPNVLRLVKMRQRRDGMLPPEPRHDEDARGSAPPQDEGAGRSSTLVASASANEASADERYESIAKGERGSGVVEVRADAEAGGTGRSAWRMKAVHAHEVREISRRK